MYHVRLQLCIIDAVSNSSLCAQTVTLCMFGCFASEGAYLARTRVDVCAVRHALFERLLFASEFYQ